MVQRLHHDMSVGTVKHRHKHESDNWVTMVKSFCEVVVELFTRGDDSFYRTRMVSYRELSLSTSCYVSCSVIGAAVQTSIDISMRVTTGVQW